MGTVRDVCLARGGRRQERQEERQERREDWHDYAHDHYDDYYDDGYYPYGAGVDAAAGEVLATPPWWALDCAAPIDVNGSTYYECESAWYVRVYHDGEVAYAKVNPPPGR